MTETRQLIVLGAGGHAKVLIGALKLNGAQVLGIADRLSQNRSEMVLGVPIIGDDEFVMSHSPDDLELINGLGCLTSTAKRQEIFDRFTSLGYRFATVRHPAAIISPDVSLACGVQVMAGAIVQPGTMIGINSILNTGSSVDHDCRIGSHVHIAPGAILAGDVLVGNRAIVGAGAVVIQGIQIGEGALIAAGAVVNRHVAPGDRVAGVPARIMNDCKGAAE